MENKKKQLKNLRKFWKGKHIFLTGHTGFKGSWMSILLNVLGAKITGYALKPERESLFKKANLQKLMNKNIYNDILKPNKLQKAIKLSKPDILIHMAAQPLVNHSFKFPETTFNTNAIGTMNVLSCIKKFKSIKSAVIVTTDKVYKNKNKKKYVESDELGGYDPYSSSKVCAEIITESFINSFFKEKNNLQHISTARSGNVIGGGDYSKDRLVPDILRSIKSKKKLVIRNPNAIRPWQHVIEPLIGYLLLAQKQHENKLKNLSRSWNFGPNDKNFKSVIQIVRKIKKYNQIKFTLNKKKKFHETQILKLNSAKAKKYLNWCPKWDLNNSLEKINEWEIINRKGLDIIKICEDQILSYFKI